MSREKAKVIGRVALTPRSATVSNAWKLRDLIDRLASTNHWLDAETSTEFIIKAIEAKNDVARLEFIYNDLQKTIEGLKKAYGNT